MNDAPGEFLERWTLTSIGLVAETGLARVWKVGMRGTFAALKVYKRADRGNEAAGSRLLTTWQDRYAVRILKEAENAVLLEWLEGPSLGDVARSGNVDTALNHLAETAAQLHRRPQPLVPGLKPLEAVFAPLFHTTFAETCAPTLKQDMQQAAVLARDLLGSKATQVPLHGDLHPDNVILTHTGPRVIDAKGYVGDPAFELANALRHPKGMPELVRDALQVSRCLTLYSDALSVSPERLASWAAAKCALSICWRSCGQIANDSESDLLNLFLRVAR